MSGEGGRRRVCDGVSQLKVVNMKGLDSALQQADRPYITMVIKMSSSAR